MFFYLNSQQNSNEADDNSISEFESPSSAAHQHLQQKQIYNQQQQQSDNTATSQLSPMVISFFLVNNDKWGFQRHLFVSSVKSYEYSVLKKT